MSETLTIDDLTFDVRRSARRTTVGITVDRDGELRIDAPTDCPDATISQIAHDRRLWVYQKLAEKALLSHPTVVKEFVDGEGFPYLGRSHRLTLVDPPAPAGGEVRPPLQLRQGRFQMRRDALPRAREHFIDWYGAHARLWLDSRIKLWAERIGVQPTRVAIRDLGYRWGSCGSGGGLNFHWRCMMLPPRIIDYLIAHELVHLHEPRHDPAFWGRLRRAMPDYEARQRWLAAEGGRFDLGDERRESA